MKILDSYISRRFLGVLFFSLIAFVTIFIVVDLVEKLDSFIDRDVPNLVIAKMYLFSLPYILVLTLPVAMLLSSLFSIGNMARHNEIVAMKAAGISLYRILMPLFFIGMMVSFAALLFGEYIVPRASESFAILNDQYLEKHRESWRKRINNVYLRDAMGRTVLMRYFDAAHNVGHTVSIRRFDREKLVNRIDAKRMVWEDSVWVLYEGFERAFQSENEQASAFERRLLEDENLRPIDFARVLKKTEEMSFRDLKAFIAEVRNNGSDPSRWLVDLYLKIAVPFANFIIVLFGAPLSSPKRRGGAATGFGISLAICFIYFGTVKFTQTLGQNGHLQPLFAAWLANGVFAIAGLVVLFKVPK